MQEVVEVDVFNTKQRFLLLTTYIRHVEHPCSYPVADVEAAFRQVDQLKLCRSKYISTEMEIKI